RENILRNGFADKARAITLDVVSPDIAFRTAGMNPESFDCVMMNPPFNDTSLQPSPDPSRRMAHVARHDTLHGWLRTAARLLRKSGTVSLIWRAKDQKEVLRELETEFGSVKLQPVLPRPDQPAIRILVNAVKG